MIKDIPLLLINRQRNCFTDNRTQLRTHRNLNRQTPGVHKKIPETLLGNDLRESRSFSEGSSNNSPERRGIFVYRRAESLSDASALFPVSLVSTEIFSSLIPRRVAEAFFPRAERANGLISRKISGSD